MSSKPNCFIRSPARQKDRSTIDNWFKCSATFGNGRAAPTRHTLVIAPPPGRLANTTANLCATNTSCVVVPAPPLALTFAVPIVISFNRKNAGSSPESDSHATQSKSPGLVALCTPVDLTMTGDSISAPPQVSAPELADFL